MKKVQVVTDSTADMPESVVRELGVRVVPIWVRFGNKSYRDGVDITKEEFYSRLSSSDEFPSTSQPTPEDFSAVYKECAAESEGIVSIHVSSKLSGTFNSASLARKSVGDKCPVEVIDSKAGSGALGLAVMAAARAAKAGAAFHEVVAEARKAVGKVGLMGMVGTMKYLARSGRVSKAIAAATRFLNVMPLLTLRDGEIAPAGLVRAVSKGMDRLCEYVKKNLPVSEMIIVHSRVLEQAKQLRDRLSEYFPKEKAHIVELGAGLGVHGGPGVLLVTVRRS